MYHSFLETKTTIFLLKVKLLAIVDLIRFISWSIY